MIEAITNEEFTKVRKARELAPELAAVRALQPGQAIKFPCRWRHTKVCLGVVAAHGTRHKMGFKVQTRCSDKALYVRRV